MDSKKARYSYEEMETLLSRAGFLIFEHMDMDEVTEAFLKDSGLPRRALVTAWR